MQNNLRLICEKFNLGKIISTEKQNGSQNDVYKVITENGKYIIKAFSKDAINSNYHLSKRKSQIAISEILNRNGIRCILPIKLNNKYFVKYNSRYYLVYPYIERSTLADLNITEKQIVSLAKTQSEIHNLRIFINLPCAYKKINIDFDKELKRFKKQPDVCKSILDNKDKLISLIENSNQNISKMKKNLCISHNDYKHLNILWEEDHPVLLDFDATGLVNPTCAMCESAYTFAKNNKGIDLEIFKLYVQTYKENYGEIKENFKDALYVSMNGKLQWLNYLFSKKRYVDVQSMVNTLVTFYDYIDLFNECFETIKD